MKREQIFKQKNDSLGQSIYIVGRLVVHNLWNGNINDTDVEKQRDETLQWIGMCGQMRFFRSFVKF